MYNRIRKAFKPISYDLSCVIDIVIICNNIYVQLIAKKFYPQSFYSIMQKKN